MGIEKLDIAVNETTITTAADIMPASTATCPITTPPTTEIAGPIALGILIPASRNISNVNSIKNVSNNTGNGTSSRCAAMFISNAVGSISDDMWLSPHM